MTNPTQPSANPAAEGGPTDDDDVNVKAYVTGAPETIFLNIFTDEFGEVPFPSDHEGITWAEDNVGDADVAYIRLDISQRDLTSAESRLAAATEQLEFAHAAQREAEKQLASTMAKDAMTISDLSSRLAAAEAERDGYAKDAGRYVVARQHGYGIADWTEHAKPMIRYLEHADAAIDFAIRKPKE